MVNEKLGKRMKAELEKIKDEELKEIRELMFGPASVESYTDAIYRLDEINSAISYYKLDAPDPELCDELNGRVPELIQKIRAEYSKSPDTSVKTKAEAFLLVWETRGTLASRYSMT